MAPAAAAARAGRAPLANDPDAAVYAAFDAARRTGTAEAWRDFARTYASHPLAAEATRLASP